MRPGTTSCEDQPLSQETLVPAIPAAWYCNPDIYEVERRHIFQREWLYLAHDAELPRPGDYLTADLAGFPLLLLRDQDSVLRCFHNVCRHRGAPLLLNEKGSLAGQGITCPYHGWTYARNGELRQAPMCENLDPEQRAGLGLLPVAVTSMRGLVFVNLAPSPEPFESVYRELIAAIDGSGYAFTDYLFHSKVVREGMFNWKTWVDGYQECYHCPTTHPIFNRDFALRRYRVDCGERFARHSCERKRPSESGADQGLWLWLYPNLGLPCYAPGFYTLQVNPLAPARTRLTYTFHFHRYQIESQVNEFIEFVDQVTNEDIAICERVQRNYQAGVFERGVLVPGRENGVAYFHQLLREAIDSRPGSQA